MKDSTSLKALIEADNSGKPVPAIQLVKQNPAIAAALSKLHHSQTVVNHDSQGNRRISNPNHSNIIGISRSIQQKSNDNESVLELFPELRLAGDILISSIIAPQDMNSTELGYSLPSNLKVSSLSNLILPIIQDYLVTEYGIEKLVPEMIKKVLLIDGCYPIVVIPENSVDDLINGKTDISLENLKEHINPDGVFISKGILGNNDFNHNKKAPHFSLENFVTQSGYTTQVYKPTLSFNHKDTQYEIPEVVITDNFNVLKLPSLIKARSKQALSRILDHGYGIGSEGVSKLTDKQLMQLLYKNKKPANLTLRKVKTDEELERETVGAPLIIKLPPESVIPVYQPGNFENHVGYFVLLDSEGNPLDLNDSNNVYDDMRYNQYLQSNMNSGLVSRVSNEFNVDCKEVTFMNMSKVYSDIFEADLMARLKNGIIGGNLSIGKTDEVARIMLARMFSKQRTQILFIPSELMTYFAIDFRKNGTGKSLLDGMMVLNALRATMLFANVNRSVINSIGRTEAEINIDEKDPQPRKTLEIAMHEILKTKQAQAQIPPSVAPNDIISYIASASTQIKLGTIPGLPSTSINFNEVNTNYQKPDSELEEMLKDRQIMSLGIPTEMVDGKGTDFATTATNNNLLLSKRVTQYQEKFEPLITDNARKVLINHGVVMADIRAVIKDNISKLTEIIDADPFFEQYKDNEDLLVRLLALEAVSNFNITLAKPSVVSLESLIDAYDVRSQAVDKFLESYFTSDIFSAAFVGEQVNERIDEIKNMIKGQLMRAWITQNNMLPDATGMFGYDDDGNPIVNVVQTQQEHTQAAVQLVKSLLEKTTPVSQAAERDLEKITGGEDLGDSTASDYSSSSSSDDSDSSDDSGGEEGEGGDDNLDSGLEMPSFDDF